LQLPGEAPDSSSSSAARTAASSSTSASSAGRAGGPICGPAVPTTDGGSVNLTSVVPGVSLNGC
jgi:hypothetical protein